MAKKKPAAGRLIEYASDADYQEVVEYGHRNFFSFQTSLRHWLLRQLLQNAGGAIPTPQELAAEITRRGLRCTPERIADDLKAMGWRTPRDETA